MYNIYSKLYFNNDDDIIIQNQVPQDSIYMCNTCAEKRVKQKRQTQVQVVIMLSHKSKKGQTTTATNF